MGVVEIKDLSFNYDDKKIFDKLNLFIKKGSFVTILAGNGKGKTTFIKLLLGFAHSSGIKVFDKPLNEHIRYVRQNVSVVFERPSFIEDTVQKEIGLSLLGRGFTEMEITQKVLSLTKKLGISHLLATNPIELNLEEAYLVSFACAIISKPKILIIDNVLNYFDIKILKNLNKQGITIINLTTNSEEIFYGNYIFFIDKKVVFAGTVKKLLNNLDVFEKTKTELPFIIDLSNKLMFYSLTDKRYINVEKLVNDVWK